MRNPEKLSKSVSLTVDLWDLTTMGYGISFDGLGSWCFGNDIDRNILIFDVDNSSLSQ